MAKEYKITKQGIGDVKPGDDRTLKPPETSNGDPWELRTCQITTDIVIAVWERPGGRGPLKR
jgi:hypothetical protein